MGGRGHSSLGKTNHAVVRLDRKKGLVYTHCFKGLPTPGSLSSMASKLALLTFWTLGGPMEIGAELVRGETPKRVPCVR